MINYAQEVEFGLRIKKFRLDFVMLLLYNIIYEVRKRYRLMTIKLHGRNWRGTRPDITD
jgi:hypothetical protein